MLNNINVQGRFTADPELKTTASGSKFATFTIASQRRKDSAGNYETDFISCVTWGTQAEFVSRWFKKGSMAIISGRLQSRNFEAADGSKRISHEVFVYECNFAGPAEKKPESQGKEQAPEIEQELDFEF